MAILQHNIVYLISGAVERCMMRNMGGEKKIIIQYIHVFFREENDKDEDFLNAKYQHDHII